MTTSSTTLLLVTGLFSVGMAAIGYYYLQTNSKKPRALTNDSSEADGLKSQKTLIAAAVTEEEKITRVELTVPDKQTSGARTSSSSVSRTTGKTIAASESETIAKSVATKMPMSPLVSPKKAMLPLVSPKKALASPKTTVQKVVEPHVVESSVVVEASEENLSCTKSSSKKTAESPRNEIKSPVSVLSEPFNTSPKKAFGTPKKIVEIHKQTIESQYKASKTPKTVVTQAETVSPKKTLGSPSKIVDNPKEAIDTQNKVVEQAKFVEQTKVVTVENSKKTSGSLKKAVENPKQTTESQNKVGEQTEALTIEHPKQTFASSSKKQIAGPKKSTEPAPASEKSKSVTRKANEDFIVSQAVAETANAFADRSLQEMLENIALEQDYVQVDLTQSMTLSQSTPELINIEDAAMKTEGFVSTSAVTEDKASIVEEEQEHAQISCGPIKPASVEPVVDTAATTETVASSPVKRGGSTPDKWSKTPPSAEPVVDTAATTETVASPETSDTTPVSWESIILSPEMEAALAHEPTAPLSLDASVENTESAEPLSIHVPAESTEELAEDKGASSPEKRGGSTPDKWSKTPPSDEPVVDTAATTETVASPETSDTTPLSWESIILSPEMEAAPAHEPTTLLSLDTSVENTESTEPLSIHVPTESTEELAEDKSASSPVDSGGSTPGKRNRNRSKKSKSKKKKAKKH